MNKDTNKFYITTPIYYVNDKPHVGHAYTTVMADVLARYQRLARGQENVFFLTGTDEHGSKVANSAQAHNLSPQQYADLISEDYKAAWQALDISYDEFFRTTDPRHKQVVRDYLQSLYDQGFIYKGNYKGLYCIGCEKFLSADEVIGNACPYHPTTPLKEHEEENYFLKLQDLSAAVLKELESGSYQVLPAERKNEVLSKIKGGVNDISISRSAVDWGIKLPWDETQTVYVWVDALLNYYSAVKIYPDKEKFWPPTLHLMAKDILWFHALIWEAMLLAKQLELPQAVFAHGFFTIDGQKMSKTLGNVINPLDLVGEYGTDGARYLLITSFSFGGDGDISRERFLEKYNADLANGIGNLVARIAKLCETAALQNSQQRAQSFSPEVAQHLEAFKPDEAAKAIWRRIADFDRIIGEDKPWKLNGEQLTGKLEQYIKEMLQIAFDLTPFIPQAAERIQEIFSSASITKPDSVFPRK